MRESNQPKVARIDAALALAQLQRHHITEYQYFTVQPYGVVLAVETGLPVSASVNATRT